MTTWRAINRHLYRARYAVRAAAARRRGAVAATAMSTPREVCPNDAAANQRILHVAWGRIGDAILSTGVLKHFRRAFPGQPIVHLGRAETELIVAPFVDQFVAFDEAAWTASAAARIELANRLAGSYDAIISDIHLFYGGTHALGDLLDALPARHRMLYEGYHGGAGLAPVRHTPAGFEVVKSLPKDPASVAARHVLYDAAHHLEKATQRIRGLPYRAADTAPDLRLELDHRPEFAAAVAWQPCSNNRKKDYPAARWREVLAAFPDVEFVALGTDPAAVDAIGAPNVRNLAGRTNLRDAASIIGSAAAFLGPDSGLTHLAACLRRPTVCVAQSSNLGYFFPYPRELGFDHLRTVAHRDYAACSGCFMTCEHEAITTTARHGARCIRELPPREVIEALQHARAEIAAAATHR